jgi:hypothetical protein
VAGLMIPLKQTYDVPLSALELLRTHSSLFHAYIMKNAKKLFENCVGLMAHQNKDIKYNILEMMIVLTR